ncbi:MAG: LptF/LptG family permease [Bacteriovoracaceae bacterium]|nr:LptF/LptG family permease [Bacteriovoracaceae bacterium]
MKLLLQKYLTINYLLAFLVSCSFFVAFLLSFRLFSLTSLIVNKGLSVFVALELFAYMAVSLLPMGFPLACLFSAIFCMSKLSGDSEYIAMRSLGMNRNQILLPFLLASAILGLIILMLGRSVIPYSEVRLKNIISSLESSQFLADIKEGRFFNSIPNVVIFSEKVSDDGKYLENIFIHIDTPSSNTEKTIFAKSGHMIKKRDFETAQESLRLVLEDGNINTAKLDGESIEKILFKGYDFPITDGSFKPSSASNKPSVMVSSRISEILKMSPEELKKNKIKESLLPKMSFEYWSRINTPLLCVLFTLLGACIGIQDNRGKKKNIGVISLVIILCYYGIFFGLISLGLKGTLPVWFTTFVPSLLVAGYVYFNYKKLDWIGS